MKKQVIRLLCLYINPRLGENGDFSVDNVISKYYIPDNIIIDQDSTFIINELFIQEI